MKKMFLLAGIALMPLLCGATDGQLVLPDDIVDFLNETESLDVEARELLKSVLGDFLNKANRAVSEDSSLPVDHDFNLRIKSLGKHSYPFHLMRACIDFFRNSYFPLIFREIIGTKFQDWFCLESAAYEIVFVFVRSNERCAPLFCLNH